MCKSYLSLSVREASNTGVSFVTGQDEADLGVGAGVLAHSGVN